MTFRNGLLHARSHIVFLAGLIAAFMLVHYLENRSLLPGADGYRINWVEVTSEVPKPDARRLSIEEQEWARTAWEYFADNTQDTGLVDSVANYHSTTLWDTSSYLLGLIAAYRLGVVDRPEFDNRMTKALQSISSLKLVDGALPNKSYNTQTLQMTDYANNPSIHGIGWSAIDIARLLVPVNIILWNYPKHAPLARKIVSAWDLSRMVNDGMLIGAAVDENGTLKLVQEGRIGYEEYAAKTMLLLGYDVTRALQYDDFVDYVSIYDLEIPTDLRTPALFDAHNYVVSESYILSGLEFGLDSDMQEYAWRVYKAQERRFEDTGQLTAVSEDHIDREPWFVYNTLFVDGKAWNTITDTGADAHEHRTISTKAALGWHMLFDTSYTSKLVSAIEPLQDSDRGWFSGVYESDETTNTALTANTNGIVLESLHYRAFGPLVRLYDDMATASDVYADGIGSEITEFDVGVW